MEDIVDFNKVLIEESESIRDWYCYDVETGKKMSSYSLTAKSAADAANYICGWSKVDVYDDSKKFCGRFEFDSKVPLKSYVNGHTKIFKPVEVPPEQQKKNKERDELFFSLDKDRIMAYYDEKGHDPDLGDPDYFWDVTYLCICYLYDAPPEVRKKAVEWLTKRGYDVPPEPKRNKAEIITFTNKEE